MHVSCPEYCSSCIKERNTLFLINILSLFLSFDLWIIDSIIGGPWIGEGKLHYLDDHDFLIYADRILAQLSRTTYNNSTCAFPFNGEGMALSAPH